jgi:hypothetical protein
MPLRQTAGEAPLYWTQNEKGWSVFTLRGEFSLDEVKDSPVSQISYFEADAYRPLGRDAAAYRV